MWPSDELSQPKCPLIRIYSEKNIKKYCCIIKDRLEIFNSNYSESDDVYEQFYETVDACFTHALTQQSRKRSKDKTCITATLKISIKHKNRLYRKKLNNPTDSNILKYKQYKNRLDVVQKEQWVCIITKHVVRYQTQQSGRSPKVVALFSAFKL